MSNIVFVSQHVKGTLYPAFALARKLQRRGHVVTFAVQPDCEEMVRAQGFQYAPLWEDIFPKGWLKWKDDHESKPDLTAETPYPKEYLDTLFSQFERAGRALGEGELQRALGKLKPDLFITDTDKPELGIAAHTYNVPVFSFAAVMASPRDAKVPPLATPFVPDDTPEFAQRNRETWDEIISGMLAEYEQWGNYPEDLRALAKKCGYPPERIDVNVEMSPRLLDHPELLFFPRVFDLPREKPIENAYYVEPMVDLARVETPFADPGLDASKRLVYCAVGTWDVVMNQHGIKPFMQSLLDAVAQRPKYQLVVGTGHYLDRGEFRCPPNAFLRPELPQIALLQKAALTVHHAGRATIMESICFGVPMLAAWSGRDNPGYAVRVEHHGLGLQREMSEISPEEMGALLDRLDAPAFYETSKRWSEHFRRLEHDSPASKLIELALERKPLPDAPSFGDRF